MCRLHHALLLLAASALTAVSGCGGRDPILDRADADADAPTTPQGGATTGTHAVRGADPPTRGDATAPKPATPAAPKPGTSAEPGAVRPGDPEPVRVAPPPPPTNPVEATVTLSGTVTLADHHGGPIRIDIFDGDQRAASGGGARPSVVAMARLDQPGPFSVQVPESKAGQVWIGAFADEDGDGRPSPSDPECWFQGNPVAVSDSAHVDLVLEQRPPPPAGP